MAAGDLLAPVVREADQHPSFRALITEPRFEPAREKLRDVWAAMPDPDDHFIREFQTGGFDARVWELVVFAVGHFGPYVVTAPEDSPDYLFERDGLGVWIEVTTANPGAPNVDDMAAAGVDEDEILFQRMNNVLPIRLGSPLYSKLQRRYWELPHVVGRPLVIAIEDFSDVAMTRMTDAPLFRYLYGMEHRVVSLPGEAVRIEAVKIAEHRHGAKVIPSGFFDLPGAENISAVIFSNDGTIPKFNRLGFDGARHLGVRMTRVGTCINFDPTATVPAAFGYLVGDFAEEWGHGMSVYHNPRAVQRIPVTFFEGFSGRHWIETGDYDNRFRDFSPLSSLTAHYDTRGRDQLDALDTTLRREADRKAAQLAAAIRDGVEFLAWRDVFVD